MQISNIVEFSSHPRPFLVRDRYCTHADCTCNAVCLTFTELRNSGDRLPKPLAFRVWVDLDSWEESNPPERPPQVTAWIQEFLASCSTARIAEFKAAYQEEKRIAKRRAEYTIDPDDVIRGTLIAFADVLEEEGALSSGYTGYAYEFFHRGRKYLIEDKYCPNPDCDCQTFHVEFFEAISDEDEDQPKVALYQRMLGPGDFRRPPQGGPCR